MEKKTRKSSAVEFNADAIASNKLRAAASIIHGNISAMVAFGSDEAPATYSIETRKALKEALASLNTLAPGLFKSSTRTQSSELRDYRSKWGKFLFSLKGMPKEQRKKAVAEWKEANKPTKTKASAGKEVKK